MTIPCPTFLLVDDCPGRCTIDQSNTRDYQPDGHGTTLLKISNGDDGGYDDEIRLDHCAEQGLEVSVTIAGDEALCTPIEGASERLIQRARAFLTAAAYRLGVIEDCEESMVDSATYSLTFADELPSLAEVTGLLEAPLNRARRGRRLSDGR